MDPVSMNQRSTGLSLLVADYDEVWRMSEVSDLVFLRASWTDRHMMTSTISSDESILRSFVQTYSTVSQRLVLSGTDRSTHSSWPIVQSDNAHLKRELLKHQGQRVSG